MAGCIYVFKKFYVELAGVLPMIIVFLVGKLYSSALLSGSDKGYIDSLCENRKKNRIRTRPSNKTRSGDWIHGIV